MSEPTKERHSEDHAESPEARAGGRTLRHRLRSLGRRFPRSSGALAGSPPGAGGRLLQL